MMLSPLHAKGKCTHNPERLERNSKIPNWNIETENYVPFTFFLPVPGPAPIVKLGADSVNKSELPKKFMLISNGISGGFVYHLHKP